VEPAPEVSEEEPEELAAPAVEAPVERDTAPAFELEETTPWSAGPPTLAAERAAPPRAEPVATATLGELYLRQGHLAEAERIFREVLNREPDNDVAQQGLARAIARQAEGRPVEGRDLPARYEPAASGEAGAKARKRRMLNNYLQRLRRGSQRDVS
jgi:predicted Zn-dependent protease